MPRPKRNKIAPSAPAALPTELLSSTRAQSRRINSVQPQSSSDSCDSNGAIGKKVASKNEESNKEEAFMSGALGSKSKESRKGGKRSLRSSNTRTVSESTETNKENKESEPANSELAEEQIQVPSSIPPKEIQQEESPSLSAAPMTVQKPASQRNVPHSANWRAQATPRLESSFLPLNNFRRRSRQPSILGIGRQDDTETTISNFDDTSLNNFDYLDPVAATPSKHQQRQAASPVIDSIETAEMSTSIPQIDPLSLSSSASRKRKLAESQPQNEILVRRSPSLTAEEADRFFGSSPGQDILSVLSDKEGENEPELPSPKRQRQRRSQKIEFPEVWSDTMAPPESSPSPTTEPQETLNIQSPSPKKKSRLEHQKPTKAQTRGQKSRALQTLASKDLQALLPRRKAANRKDDSEMPSGYFDHEPTNSDVETSFIPNTKKSKRNKTTTSTTSTASKILASKSKQSSKLRDKTNLKSPVRQSKSNSASKSKKTALARTYSRITSADSDKENHPTNHHHHHHGTKGAHNRTLDIDNENDNNEDEHVHTADTTMADLDPKSKRELKSVAEKFAEVDKWEMEFEHVSSSQSDAR
jgi:hypothetical protein